MYIGDIPFMAVTVPAIFVHIVAALAAHYLEPEQKGDSRLNLYWAPAQLARLFTVRRSDVKRPVTWGFVLVSRIALIVSGASLALDLVLN